MKFSIIIPVYNVAPYLSECLESVIAQTHGDWEAICVDDGSTDLSPAMLGDYAKRDSRFIVLHQQNAGVSVARNNALAVMTGDYFLFLDGDDTLLPGALARVDECLRDSHADAVFTSPIFYKFNDGESIDVKPVTEVGWSSVESRRELIVGEHGVQGFVYGRVLSCRKFGAQRFPVGMVMAEDLIYWVDVLKLDAQWVMMDGGLETYRIRPGSACNTMRPKMFTDVFDAYCYVAEALRVESIFGKNAVEAYWDKWRGVYQSFVHRAYANRNIFSRDQQKRVLHFNQELCDTLGYYPLGTVAWMRWMAGRLHAMKWFLPIAARLDWLIMGTRARVRRLCK